MAVFQEDDNMLAYDRDDLLALLQMRFGDIPDDIIREIGLIGRSDMLQRLILVAANAADWQVFAEELQAGSDSFKLVGERFQPMAEGGGQGE